MTIASLWNIINTGGTVGLLAFGVFALWSGLIVPRSIYRAQQRETRFYKQAFWVAAGLAKGVTPSFDFEHEHEEGMIG